MISVEGIGKRYQLSHEVRRDTLRDTLGQGVRGLARRLFGRSRNLATEEFWALKDVSFDVKQGEAVGIIGRNGAGKSTLLKVLSRITEPTLGTIRLRGRVASLLEVGTGFHPELSGRENIYLNGAILGMSHAEIRRKFDEIVAFAEVERFLDTPVKHYSSGMYVRLAFAVAAHLEPEILIVDEVLAVGDAAFQQKCLGKMESVSRKEGRTVLLVSHNMVTMQQLCSRILLLKQGRLAPPAPPLEQIRNYLGAGKHGDRITKLGNARRTLDPIGRALLSSVELNGDTSLPDWVLPYDEPLRLDFIVEVKAPFATFELGLGLFNLQGMEIVSVLSSWQQNLGPVVPGIYSLTVDYGILELAPGTYSFGVGLRSERGLEDYLAEAFSIEVVASRHSVRPNLNTIRGAIARTAKFSIKRNGLS